MNYHDCPCDCSKCRRKRYLSNVPMQYGRYQITFTFNGSLGHHYEIYREGKPYATARYHDDAINIIKALNLADTIKNL